MGTQIQDIVNITISRENAKLVRAGFGIPLFLGVDNRTDNLITAFSDAAEMLSAGYKTSDELYKMASIAMKQEYSPEFFYIGRVKGDSNCLQNVQFDADATAGTYTLSVGTETTASIDFDATNLEIATALELLTGVAEVTITGDATEGLIVVEFTGVDANTDFALMSADVDSLTGVGSFAVSKEQFGSEAETYESAMIDIWNENRSWYSICTDAQDDDTIEEIADWIEDKNKLYFAVSSNITLLNSETNIASKLKAKSYKKTAIYYHAIADEHFTSGLVGGQLPKNAGSITWAFKEVVGATPDVLKTSEINNLILNNVNYYEEIAGRKVTSNNAVVVSGEYIDIMRGIHWLEARISENVFLGMVIIDKIPYTQDGINYAVSKMRSVLQLAADDQSFITPDYTINTPDILSVPIADKSSRTLNDVSFSAVAEGAIHKLNIIGKLSD